MNGNTTFHKTRYNYWLDISHDEIDKGYNEAISRYEEQKTQLMELINTKTKMSQQEFVMQLNNEIEQDVNNETLQTEMDNVFNYIRNYFEEEIAKKITEDPSSTMAVERLQTRLSQLKESKRAKEENYYKNSLKDLEEFIINFTKDVTSKKMLQQHLAKIAPTSMKSNTDVQQLLLGFLRQLVFQRYMQSDFQIKLSRFKMAYKGYARERGVYEPFSKFMSKIFGYGETGVSLSAGAHDEKDITFWIPPTSIQVEDHIETVDFLGSIQSKSWVTPWSVKDLEYKERKKFNTYNLEIGSRADLLPAEEYDRYFWHAGLYQIMHNLQQVIGYTNVLFSTGNQIYWTSDLLAEFKNQNYVLAFVKENHGKGPKLSFEVAAVYHHDK